MQILLYRKAHAIVQTLNRSWILWQQGVGLLFKIFLKLSTILNEPTMEDSDGEI